MNAIIINEKNLDKIAAAIAEAEGRATARTIDVNDIMNACKRIETHLAIPKAYMDGLVYDVDPNGQTFPRAYKYSPESTHFVLTYKNKSWRVSDIRRDWTRTPSHRYDCKVMPDAAKEALIRSREVF